MLVPSDFILRLGGVFNNGDDDELTASTLAGSRDFFGDMSIGWILNGDKNRGRSFNLELIGSGVTDRGISEVHERLGIGFSWTKRTLKNHTLMARFSYNRLDTPELNSAGLILADASGNPKFASEWGYGFEGEYNILFGKNIDGYLTFGMKVFGSENLNPDPWLVWLGYSVPLDKIPTVLPLGNAFQDRLADFE